MNKKGKTAPLVTVLLVVVIITILALGYFMIVKQTQLGPKPGEGQSTTDCNIAPSLVFSTYNELQRGAQVATHKTVIVNGIMHTPGVVPSSFQYGDKVQILYNASDFIDVAGPTHTMVCGVNTLTQGIYATDDPTVRFYNTDGIRLGTHNLDNCALHEGVNQSKSTTSINLKTEIQSSPLESSGELIIIVEYTNSTEVGFSDLTLSGTGVKDATIPSYYVSNSTLSTVRAFSVPATTNGVLNQYYINFKPKVGQEMGAKGTKVFVTIMSKQDFYDTDGTFKNGVEDSNGVAKYEDIERYGLCIL